MEKQTNFCHSYPHQSNEGFKVKKYCSAAFIFLIYMTALLSLHSFAQPLAEGKNKFLGCSTSSYISKYLDRYWNQVTPGNDGKWGSVEYVQGQYNWTNLDKIYNLDIGLVLPGHKAVFKNYKERIQELKHHHQIRIEEVLSILQNGTMDAYQVASKMNWDIPDKNWEHFPVFQKWFAFGEAVAHLTYLLTMDKIKKEQIDSKIIFSRMDSNK